MQNTNDTIFFNFSYTALKLLGDGLYSNPWTAISELIANGIDADATKIYLYINMINKQSSTIEIFDNGYGMTYNDLAEKYALIGKNKRFDKELNEDKKVKVMGRKGIGKLAALYLTSTYYLISKTQNELGIWCLDMNSVQGDEIPCLKKTKETKIESENQWKKCKTGTLIKLVNVDLRNIGEQTIAGLKSHIADYYAFNEENIEIFVAVRQHSDDTINFEKAEKQIAFKNFYAFFNNSGNNFKSHLAPSVLLRTEFSEKIPNTKKVKEATKDVYYKVCPIKVLNNIFQTSGNENFLCDNGKLSKKLYEYTMIGWIGIHATIEKREAKLNDEIFIKNKAYQPNRLRLYVRNKLAVENFMEYLHNTQAFGKYIEGEIHFDILDDNELPDIATAGRQNYKENNDRIQKLVEILKPIINSLVKARVETGHQIRKEKREFDEAIQVRQNEKIKKARSEAKEARDERNESDRRRKKIEEELEQEKKQSIFQRSIIGREKEQIMGLQHHIKHSASRIKTNAANLYKYLNKNKAIADQFIINHLSIISRESDKIGTIAKYVTNANFNLKSTEITEDIIRFMQEYINEIFLYVEKEYPKIVFTNIEKIVHVIEFRPLEIASLIDNLIHNAKKANAEKVTFSFSKKGNMIEIKILDDGMGIPERNIPKIFDFGFTTTDGSGIGLYMVKKTIENLKGRIEVVSKESIGTTFKILL